MGALGSPKNAFFFKNIVARNKVNRRRLHAGKRLPNFYRILA